jgi:V/A-type H+-transporting ATPase subunit C
MARLDVANARLGARRARIAGTHALRALLARGGPGEGAEGALREALAVEAGQLLRWVEGRRARALLAAWLGLDEAAAVKAVLRGVAAGEPVDRILAAAPRTPQLGEAALRRAAEAGGVEAAARALAASSALGAAARDALEASSPAAPGAEAGLGGPAAPAGALAAVELAVDRAAVARARETCRGRGEDGRVMARALAELTDVRNAATLLVLAGAVPAAAPWIPGGARLAPERLDRLARGGAAAARAAVAAAWRLPPAALGSPARAERALEAALVRALGREARLRPLSLAVPLAYLAARREEVRRTALVVRGAAAGLDPDELLDLVEA